jgi:acetolactate synthase-1/2/3 large subunit
VKLSDYVARFLSDQGIRHVFAVAGGASLHLIHSVEAAAGIHYICPQHEQAGAMAADAYSRVTGNLGAAIATSGPGATNLLTGVCCAYYDSVPVIYITGQVSTFRMKRDSGVRQLGFQETDTIDIYKPITKYAVQIDDPQRIRYELEKAAYLARSGRKGPVLIDIPDDIQRTEIHPDRLESFVPPKEGKQHRGLSEDSIRRLIALINQAERPILIFGWGIRLANAEEEVRRLVTALGFPVALTWAAMDILPSNNSLVVGAFGTHGTRHGNFAVQNSDLLIAIGARLDTREAGSPITTFAREAKKVIVDIDPAELNKFKMLGLNADLLIQADGKEVLQAIHRRLHEITPKNISNWKAQIKNWKTRFPICPPAYYDEKELNPYVFMKALSNASKPGEVIIVDTGCAVAWTMQAFEFKTDQRLLHDCNNTAMGYALPASIGACFALDGKPITCITGDGSLQMNIQELATVMRHRLPIKIFLINNHGYSMIQQTQDQWLDSRYLASTVEGGLAFPDFVKVAEAYGFRTLTISKNSEALEQIREVYRVEGPVFCNVEIRSEHRVTPQVKYGRPIEDAEPLLDRKEFFDNMIIKSAESSLQ